MTKLSVNLNKIALLRNARNIGIPSVTHAAERVIQAGAHGITVHPRPDQRHIRISDVFDLADLLKKFPHVEYNIEGNPFPEFMELVYRVRPAQCTLVPDTPHQMTSDHGWQLEESRKHLREIITELRSAKVRVSLFMDATTTEWSIAREIGADRVELYTQPYAEAFGTAQQELIYSEFARAAEAAQHTGLGVNAGHDLNLSNLRILCQIPGLLEVSIGHALVADALEMGLTAAVRAYLHEMNAA